MNEWTMTQSATGLDISDDESKAAKTSSERLDRGKENVDPNEPSAPVTRSMAAAAVAEAASRKEKDVNAMVDDERKPLADLNPTEFYAEGLDATSVVLVHDDVEHVQEQVPEPEVEAGQDVNVENLKAPVSTPTSLASTAKVIESLHVPSIGEILSSATPFGGSAKRENASVITDEPAIVEDADVAIEIWESESAKDENETTGELDAASPASVGDENVFALQEL